MNLFQRTALWFAKRAVKLAGLPLRDPSITTIFGYQDTASGIAVTEWTAMNYSAFWAANRVIGEAVACLPLGLYKKLDNGAKKQITDHPVVPIIEVAPNPEMTPIVCTETTQIHATSWGNGWQEIERNGAGEPVALWPITPDRVTADRKKNGDIYYQVHNNNGPPTNIPARDMLHIPGLGFDGVMGYSVANIARDCLGLGLATERFGNTFFGNGGHPSGILSYEGVLKNEVKENIAETWFGSHGGPDRANKVAVLDRAAKYTPISIPPDDAQFLQTRQFNVLEIARWFNLPPHMLRDLEGANNSTLEQQAIEFVTYTLTPWLLRWQQEMRRKLLTPKEQKRLFFAHDRNPLLVGDVLTRFKSYALARQWGWMSANDCRKRENENPIENGDIYLEPVNMVPAGQQDRDAEPDATPPEPGRAPATPKS